MITFFNYFVKITGFLPYILMFRTKIKYEDKKKQARHIKGKAIIMSNHTSVYDYIPLLFTFFFRTLRVQMAEVLYKKKLLALFLKMMGGIYVNRHSYDFSFIKKSEKILAKGGVVAIYPESRIPKKEETRPLEFKESITRLALESDTLVIPIYTNGSYFKKARARVIIGTPINVKDYYDHSKSEKENIASITTILRNKIIELGKLL